MTCAELPVVLKVWKQNIKAGVVIKITDGKEQSQRKPIEQNIDDEDPNGSTNAWFPIECRLVKRQK